MANSSIGECVLSAVNVTCPNANLCLDSLDVVDGHVSSFGVFIEIFLLFFSFYAVAIIADAHLVVSLETLCVRWNVREDVAGASFMAFGSAAPEIIINAVSTMKALMADADDDNEDTALGIGAIIGSGMIAFTVIPGVCGLATSEPLSLKRRPLARDVLAYSLSLVLLYVTLDAGVVTAFHAISMVGLYVLYMLTVVCSPGVRQLYRVKYLGRAPRVKMSFVEQQQQQQQEREVDSAAASTAPLQAAGVASSTAVPTVIATAVGTHDAAGLWDALPVTSPMEFSPLDISTSLSGLPLAQVCFSGPLPCPCCPSRMEGLSPLSAQAPAPRRREVRRHPTPLSRHCSRRWRSVARRSRRRSTSCCASRARSARTTRQRPRGTRSRSSPPLFGSPSSPPSSPRSCRAGAIYSASRPPSSGCT